MGGDKRRRSVGPARSVTHKDQHARAEEERYRTLKPGGSASQERGKLANNQPSAARGFNTIKRPGQTGQSCFFGVLILTAPILKFQATRLCLCQPRQCPPAYLPACLYVKYLALHSRAGTLLSLQYILTQRNTECHALTPRKSNDYYLEPEKPEGGRDYFVALLV